MVPLSLETSGDGEDGTVSCGLGLSWCGCPAKKLAEHVVTVTLHPPFVGTAEDEATPTARNSGNPVHAPAPSGGNPRIDWPVRAPTYRASYPPVTEASGEPRRGIWTAVVGRSLDASVPGPAALASRAQQTLHSTKLSEATK